MEKLFKTLERHYGTQAKVAAAIGITPRQYSRIRASLKPSKTIQKLMNHLVKAIELSS